MKLDQPGRHHCQIGHHRLVLQKAVEGLHHFYNCNVRAFVDELVIRFGRISPPPRIGESVKLRLANLAARLAEQHVVIRVRVKRRL